MKAENWIPLVTLLEMPRWDAGGAAMIVAGLHPDTALDPAHLVWLPASLPGRWTGLDATRLARRAMQEIIQAETRLHGLPVSATPYQWLSEAERRGAGPPWIDTARMMRGLRDCLPPSVVSEASRRARKRHTLYGRHDVKREALRAMWEAWALGEALYQNKDQFLAVAAEEVGGEEGINTNLIGQWVTTWERHWMIEYGRIQRADQPEHRGYGHPASVVRIRSLPGAAPEPMDNDKVGEILRNYARATRPDLDLPE